MPEFRQDPLTGRWVSIAEERAGRPFDFGGETIKGDAGTCPFCAGREHETPGERLAIRSPGTQSNGTGWQVRVVPNRYPCVVPQGEFAFSNSNVTAEDQLFRRADALGVHEVIIESPRHLRTFTQLSEDEAAGVFRIYRDRLRMLQRANLAGEGPALPYGLIFKNAGAAAGASLVHLHSQFVALPLVPGVVQEKIARSAAYFSKHGRTIWQAIIDEEVAAESRLISQTPHFTTLAPWASRFPYEMLVLPTLPASNFAEVSDGELGELARLVRSLLLCLESAVREPAYNVLIQTNPFDSRRYDHYHWHIEILPRLTKTAGYEWGTGFAINPVSPERAAAQLRQIAQLQQGELSANRPQEDLAEKSR